MGIIVTVFRSTLEALLHLFVDDGSFAFEIIGVVIVAALVAWFAPGQWFAGGAVLVLGCLGVLTLSVVRAARK